VVIEVSWRIRGRRRDVRDGEGSKRTERIWLIDSSGRDRRDEASGKGAMSGLSRKKIYTGAFYGTAGVFKIRK